MKKIIITLLMLITSLAFASDSVTSDPNAEKAGQISSFKGRVVLYDGVSPRGMNIKEPQTPIYYKNKIATKSSATAVIELVQEDKIALSGNSIMTIEGINRYKPESGKVVFSIKTRGKTEGVQIALTSAVIGVKGTEFLIDTNDDGKQACYMKEGVVEVTPIEGQFKKYLEVEIDEYEAYVREMAGEYEEYLKELEEEYVEYVDSITIKAGNAWSIEGNEVKKLEFTEEVEEAFKLLDMQ